MAILAIKGHTVRRNEVIEILEMLGGKISHECGYKDGFDSSYYFFINTDENFFIDGLAYNSEELKNYDIFTLEEFLEKFPYKIGDKVKIIDYEHSLEVVGLRWNNDAVEYEVYTTDYGYWFKVEELQPYKEQESMNIPETMKQIMNIAENFIKIDIPKGYEFCGVDDDNQQVVFEKIKPQYPKTYGECCKILELSWNEHFGFIKANDCFTDEENKLIESFIKLKRCRDAYWKIAGEQLGLGKPWKPDFTNDNEERYGIYTIANKVERDFCGVGDVNMILTFPTEEMRDAFLDSEEIAQLIENCKEFL